jgi:two-component system, NtrC family, nitrogen regulation sensor histidine kinase GlnL
VQYHLIHENINLPAGYAVLDSLPYPVILLDKSNRFIWLNHAGESFFNSSLAIIYGTLATDYFNSDSVLLKMISRVWQTATSLSEHSVNLSAPRLKETIVNIQVGPLFSSDDFIVISVQKNSLEQVAKSRTLFKGAALSMSKITALLAHEIRNPLAGIKGAAQLLELELGDENRELSNLIVTETDRIIILLERIEKLSADKPLHLEQVNIHEVLDHCLAVSSTSFGRHLVVKRDFDPSLPMISADRDLFIQLFLNLFKNASEATKQNDKLIVKTSYALSTPHSASNQYGLNQLPFQIDIIDTGSGISPELQNYIFEPFISNKLNGSGLGLALVACVVSEHGGAISVNSSVGETHFKINLPLEQKIPSPSFIQPHQVAQKVEHQVAHEDEHQDE